MNKKQTIITGWYQLTKPSQKLAAELQKSIESKYPGVTMIRDNCVYITQVHKNMCERYVYRRCNIKSM